MKNKNKFKLFATTAGLAAVAAPIITLASCNKGSVAPIIIDEKEKVKELEKGSKEATFTFQLSSAIQTADTIQVELKDIVSSKTGFTVVKSADPEYTTGSKEVKQKIMIAPVESSDAIVPEGTSITFNVEIKRLNGKGQETASVTIKDFKMTYVAPVSEGLTLVGEKVAASNPSYGEKTAQHTFQFAVGSSITIDDEATYEVELTKLETSTSGVDVKYVETTYDKVNNKLLVTFEMSKATTLSEDDQVDFDFTISSSKEGTELWRQSFSGYGIWYLSRYMYIFDDEQQERTLAGENEFYLLIATTEDLEWNVAPYQAHLEISSISEPGVTLTYDDAEVTKQQGENYWYFVVPIKINGGSLNDGTVIKYTATLKAKIGNDWVEDEFEDMSITYVTKKIDDTLSGTVKIGTTLGDSSSFAFNLPLTTPSAQTEIQCGVIPTTVTPNTTIKAGSVEISNQFAKPSIFIESKYKEANAKFDLVLQGYKDGKVAWTQYVEQFDLTYIDPISLKSQKIETEKDESYNNFGFSRLVPTTQGEIKATTATALNVVTGRNVQGVTIDDPNNYLIKATLKPATSKQLSYGSYAAFNLQVSGTYTLNGDVTNWTKTFKDCRIDYFGTLTYDGPRSQVAEPGTNLVCYEFNRKTNKIDEVIVTTDQTEQTTRKVKIKELKEAEDKYLVYINMESTDPVGDPLQDGDQVKFDITFKGKSPLGQTWTMKFGEGTVPGDDPFYMTYTSSVTAQTKEISTLPKQNKAYITLKANKPLADNEYYKVKVRDQARPDLIVSVDETEKRQPSETTFQVEATLTKTGSPLAKGDSTQFGIAVEKYTDDILTETSYIIPFTITYTDAYIKWNEDDWYVYEKTTVSSKECGSGNVRFELSRALSAGQTISVSATAGQSSDYDLGVGDATVSGTTVTVPMLLKTTTSTPNLTIGKKAIADLTITCKDSQSQTVWTESITGFELYMMSSFTAASQAISTTTTSGTLTVNMSAYEPIGATMTVNARCNKVGSSKQNLGVTCSNVDISGTTATLTINFNGSDTPAKDDYVTFYIDFIVKVTKSGQTALVTVPMFNGPVRMTKTA